MDDLLTQKKKIEKLEERKNKTQHENKTQAAGAAGAPTEKNLHKHYTRYINPA